MLDRWVAPLYVTLSLTAWFTDSIMLHSECHAIIGILLYSMLHRVRIYKYLGPTDLGAQENASHLFNWNKSEKVILAGGLAFINII